MKKIDKSSWKVLAQRYALLGNCFLKPLSPENSFVLDGALWHEIMGEESTEMSDALLVMDDVLNTLTTMPNEQVLERLAVSYTSLFVGPGKPMVPPWETLYRRGGTVLFGEATFQMKELFRRYGFQVHNENNQMEDHIGLQLLLLSALCSPCSEQGSECDHANDIPRYVEDHLLSWTGDFASGLQEHDATRFYYALSVLTHASLTHDFSHDQWVHHKGSR